MKIKYDPEIDAMYIYLEDRGKKVTTIRITEDVAIDIGEKGGINLYEYVRNNSQNKIDPEGEQYSRAIPRDCLLYIKKISNPNTNPTEPDIILHCYSCCEWLFSDPCLEPRYLQECYENCLLGCLPSTGPCIKPPKHRK